jgi:hypothetical protein
MGMSPETQLLYDERLNADYELTRYREYADNARYLPSPAQRAQWARQAEERAAYWCDYVRGHRGEFPPGSRLYRDGTVTVPGTPRYWREGTWYREKSPAEKFRAGLSNLAATVIGVAAVIGGLVVVGLVLDYIGSRG